MTIKYESTDTEMQRKLLLQVEKRLPYLTVGDTYTLAAILGESFWEGENDDDDSGDNRNDDEDCHRTWGRCFSALVAEGRVPFLMKGFTKYRHNEYVYAPN